MEGIRMRLFKIVADTYEAKPYPVVTHEFRGRTQKEAEGYFRAHLTTDKFFKDCTEKEHFANFDCRTVIRYRGWVEAQSRPG